MIVKLAFLVGGYALLKFKVNRVSEASRRDHAWLESTFIIMIGYYLFTSSLYLVSYPLSELVQEIPVKMAFLLLRLLTAFIGVTSVHLYYGISYEFDL